MFAELNSIPDLMIKAWLKELGFPRTGAGALAERVEAYVTSGRISEAQLKSFLREMKENGRKYVYLFSLPETEWTRISNLDVLDTHYSSILDTDTGRQVLSLTFQDKRKEGENRFIIRLSKTILVPKVNKEIQITHNGTRWASITFVETPVSIVFEVNKSLKYVLMRFDAVKDMGTEKATIAQVGNTFLTEVLGLSGLETVNLAQVGKRVETAGLGKIFDFIAKVETEDAEGAVMTGTMRYTRDDSSQGSAAELPGGRELIHGTSGDVLLDTYNILWLESESSEELSRSIRTTVYSDVGELYFKHHVFERELIYVLSGIRTNSQ